MKNILLSSILFFISVLPTLGNSVSAQFPVINFTDFIVLPAVDPSIVVRQRQINIDRDQLLNEEIGTIHFEFFNDVSMDALLEKTRNTDGSFIHHGTIIGDPNSSILLVIKDGRVSGEILFLRTVYQIRSLADGIHIVQEMSKTTSVNDAKSAPDMTDDVISLTNQELAQSGLPALAFNTMLSQSASDMTDEVITLTNQERAKSGLPALAFNTNLTQSAQGHADDMAQNDYYSHDSQDGRIASDRITAAGYIWNSYGENIAAGYSTAAEVVVGWINSPPHHENMLNTTNCDLGVGYAYNAVSFYDHYWVQNFGRQSGVSTCPAPPTGSAPDVVTGTATQVGTDSVNLTATVNPNGLTTTYYFEIGYTTAYGSTSSTYDAGTGTVPLSVQLTPTGFLPDSDYYFRVVAQNSMGTTYGNDVAFRIGFLTQTQVSQLYIAIFGRASEGGGNRYWQTDPQSTSMTATANVMLNTEPAKVYFGSTLFNNQAFIEHIYSNTLGKTYSEDPDGIFYWVSELESNKSKGDVIAALIVAAQHPDNAGAAQDRFNNKTEVSNYCADTISEYTDNLATFIGFLEGVTDDASSVTSAKFLIDEQQSGGICENTCQYANDGVCDDGGEGASYYACDLGTDCADCGAR